MRAPCGHSYCKTCIYSWLKHKKTCPEDRKPIKRVSDLHYDFILASVILCILVCLPFHPAIFYANERLRRVRVRVHPTPNPNPKMIPPANNSARWSLP